VELQAIYRCGGQRRQLLGRTVVVQTTGIITMKHLLPALALATIASPAIAQPTFSKDVAPMLQRSCQQCHRPGAIAPMSLLTYQDARPWAKSIKAKITAREMPPWYVDRHVGIQRFKDDPSLNDAEIATITQWADAGAPASSP